MTLSSGLNQDCANRKSSMRKVGLSICWLSERRLTMRRHLPVVALTATFIGEHSQRSWLELTWDIEPAASKSLMVSLTKSLCSAIESGLSKMCCTGCDLNGSVKPL